MKVSKKLVVLSISALFSAVSMQAKHMPGHIDTSHLKEQTSAMTHTSHHVLGGKGKYHPRKEAQKPDVDPKVAELVGRAVAGNVHESTTQVHADDAKEALKELKQSHREANQKVKSLTRDLNKAAKAGAEKESIAEKEAQLASLKGEIHGLEAQINEYKAHAKAHKSAAKTKKSKLKKVSKRHSRTARAAHRGK